MSLKFTRNRFTWLMYFMLAYYGFFLNILGPITPFLMDEMKLSYTLSSLHFTAFAVGIILVGLGGHIVIQRVGRWRALWIGAFGMSLSAVVLLAGRVPAVTIGASFLMGLVGSLILAVVPSGLADEHGPLNAVALSEANVVASLVSTISPLLVGWFAASALIAALPGIVGGWRLALVIGMLIPFALRFGIGRVQMPAKNRGTNTSAASQLSAAPLPPIYWVYWTALMLSISVEFCMIFWSADYMEKGMGLSKSNAAQAVSLFLGGMILGRLAGSRLVQRFSPSGVVSGALAVAGAGFLLFWVAPTALLGAAGLFITGLGVASLYPLILAMSIDSAGSSTVQASARSSLASGTAIFSLPLILGRLADAVGIRPAYGIVLLLLAGVLVIIQAARRRSVVIKDGQSA